MMRLADERGGAVAKLLGILLVLAVCASAAVYVYGKNQHPLAIDEVHVATIVRNDGRLPVTLEGLAPAATSPTDAYVPVSIELGDGKTPKPANGAFDPPSLDPGTGIGVVVTYAINPNLECGHFGDAPSDPTPFPSLPVRLSSYGVDTTQTIALDQGAPTVSGITKTTCGRATP